jgi:hypothetical protein
MKVMRFQRILKEEVLIMLLLENYIRDLERVR